MPCIHSHMTMDHKEQHSELLQDGNMAFFCSMIHHTECIAWLYHMDISIWRATSAGTIQAPLTFDPPVRKAEGEPGISSHMSDHTLHEMYTNVIVLLRNHDTASIT